MNRDKIAVKHAIEVYADAIAVFEDICSVMRIIFPVAFFNLFGYKIQKDLAITSGSDKPDPTAILH